MSPLVGYILTLDRSLPRTRGDEPFRVLARVNQKMSAPHPRG